MRPEWSSNPDASGDGPAAAADANRLILEVRHLSKTFPGTKALDDVSPRHPPGEVHALVGHNGSGKSTLIKVLSGYHHPDPGAEVILDGQPVEIASSGTDGTATPPA